jgi:hypothetical protein
MSNNISISNVSDSSENSYISDDCNSEVKVKRKSRINEKMSINEAIKTVEERALYTKVHRFFRKQCTQEQIQKMIDIIINNNIISLRLLNWFAMKYSATMKALEVKKEDGNIELFDVKISYKARLNTHSKKYFDPFRRGKRFDYYYNKNNKDEYIETTLCQLNFFRWLMLHNLIEFVEKNFNTLKQKMGVYEKNKKILKKEKKNKKKTIVRNKKEEVRLKVKRFKEEDTTKLVIII